MKRWCRRLVACSLFAFVMAFVATAFAASKADVARRRAYDAGVAAYRAQQYDKALEQFKKGLPLPEARRGIALTLDVMGRSAEAADEFEKFIAVAPASMAENVKKARDRVAQIRAAQRGEVVDPGATVRPAKIRVVTTPAGATITVVGQPANGVSPVELDLPPGKYRVHAVLDEYEAGEREIEVTSGSFSEVNFELVPSAKLGASSPVDVAVVGREANATRGGGAPPVTGPGASHWVAPIVTGAVGAGALGAGVIFGLSALSKKSDYDANPTEQGLSDAESTAAVSTVGFVAGGVLAVATVVLILFGDESAPPAGKAAAVGPGTFRFAF